MKLRNLLYATMIACAFASCSNDDDPIDNGGNNSNLDGKTLLQVSPDVLQTKASSLEFTVCVIDQNGLVVAKGKDNEAFELPSTAEGSVEIVALKNSVAVTVGTTTRGDLTSTISFNEKEETFGSESMNTAYFKVSVERGKLNTLGFTEEAAMLVAGNLGLSEDKVKVLSDNHKEPIPAYRNVANIYVNTISLSDAADFKKKYPEATFTPKKMYLLNGRDKAHASVLSYDRWAKTEDTNGTSYLGGFLQDDYDKYYTEAVQQDPAQEVMYVKVKPKEYNYYAKDNWENLSILHQGYARDLKIAKGGYVTLPRLDANNARSYNPDGVNIFCTYENTNADTPVLLVVQGDFTYKDAVSGKDIKAENRFYTIVVGSTKVAGTGLSFADFGFESSEDFLASFSLVRRNIRYVIYLTVSGPGAANPFIPGSDEDTYLDATVRLVDYGAVVQSEDID